AHTHTYTLSLHDALPISHVGALSLRVAHLTDLHVGRVTPMPVQYAAVDATNAEHPDLVVITGDFVCHSQRWLMELESVIARFERSEEHTSELQSRFDLVC